MSHTIHPVGNPTTHWCSCTSGGLESSGGCHSLAAGNHSSGWMAGTHRRRTGPGIESQRRDAATIPSVGHDPITIDLGNTIRNRQLEVGRIIGSRSRTCGCPCLDLA